MDTKEQLINTIREWVKTDNEIRSLQEEIKNRKNKKKQVSESLITIMKQNEIDCFDLKDGQLLYTKKSVKKPITKKVLLTILNNYFNGDYIKASEINDYILSNREEVIHEKIIHKLDN